jgi:hypothetical protein
MAEHKKVKFAGQTMKETEISIKAIVGHKGKHKCGKHKGKHHGKHHEKEDD